jgi:CubicO group peptidase (beta-lactamase class C family)
MNVLRALAGLCLTLPLSIVSAVAADAAATWNPAMDAAVRDLGREWLEQNGGIGLSIGVYDGGQRYFYNFGSTQLDGNRPPTKDTVYEIGSVGKTLTGQLLARAVVEGRASLNDEVEKYLGKPHPNLANGGEKVRLVHLANMTSQLADNIPDLSQVQVVPGEPLAVTRMRVMQKYKVEDFLWQIQRVTPPRPPGSDPAHSNVASVLLGVVLEKIYGAPFETLLAREIEKPLRMGSGTNPDIKLLATGYTADNHPLPSYGAKMSYASGSLRYSASDLLRYASWQVVERDASVKLAHQPTWFTLDKRQSVALYWIVSETPRGRRLHYSGGTWGFSSLVELYPDNGLALVALANKSTDGAQGAMRVMFAKLVDQLRPQAAATGD